MTINKFQGKTKEEAIENAKKEFGENAVIMNVREIKPKGLFGAFKSSTYEVTAAMEEKESQTLGFKPQSKIDFKADEKISIPPLNGKGIVPLNPSLIQPQSILSSSQKDTQKDKSIEERYDKNIEERLDNLSTILEEKLGASDKRTALEHKSEREPINKQQSAEGLKFVRILYNTLLSNEVDEKYVNQILGEIERFLRPGNSVDVILSNVYQKLILRFGQPRSIEISGSKPKVVFFVGPTGVGKTTTIAKIASKFKVEDDKKVAFITADTYRIAATEQLRVYANILDAPMSIVYSKEELNTEISKYSEYDIVFIDTAGFSHKNIIQKDDMRQLIDGVDGECNKEVYLVLSATTKYKDLLDIVDSYKDISSYKLIFTKLDETSCYGNLLNIKLYSGAELSYTTNGQNVPDDIELFNTQKIVKQLLGGSK